MPPKNHHSKTPTVRSKRVKASAAKLQPPSSQPASEPPPPEPVAQSPLSPMSPLKPASSTAVDYTLPEKYQKQLVDLEHEDWFHGDLPVDDVEDLLKKHGDYCLRIQHAAGGYSAMPCISVRWEGRLRHFPVWVNESSDPHTYYVETTVPAASSIGELARWYMFRSRPILAKDGPILINPVGIQVWELHPDDIEHKEKLGEGNFAYVYAGVLKAKGKRPAMPIACKVMKSNSMLQETIDEMMKEAHFMRDLNHENLVCFLGVVASKGPIQIVMELIKGGSLDVYLKKHKTSTEDKVWMCADVAAGLNYLHQQKTMHRDLAARNCLIVEETHVVKVSDFGKSKRGDEWKLSPTEPIPLRWTAPEVLSKRLATRAADVYAYGIVCWEILTNADKPFANFTHADIRAKIAQPDFRPLVPPTCPQKLKDIIKACWQTEPEKRPLMDAVLADVQKLTSSCSNSRRGKAKQASGAVRRISTKPRNSAAPKRVF